MFSTATAPQGLKAPRRLCYLSLAGVAKSRPATSPRPDDQSGVLHPTPQSTLMRRLYRRVPESDCIIPAPPRLEVFRPPSTKKTGGRWSGFFKDNAGDREAIPVSPRLPPKRTS